MSTYIIAMCCIGFLDLTNVGNKYKNQGNRGTLMGVFLSKVKISHFINIFLTFYAIFNILESKASWPESSAVL